MNSYEKYYAVAKALVSALILGAYVYLKVQGLSIPPELQDLVNLVLGLYFGYTSVLRLKAKVLGQGRGPRQVR